ncbi:competence type IV pilus minor pilin ComGD [Enterococcus dispar]|uniref:competence type IV pilus minor pilin ComGD n=1 Tax=Enterococcus dispar TaxID=44009 RepID=UPI00189C7B03|nr:competence type IV pilus minor pilin ComGD [Enterococcus dispar]WCG34259.1 competence type IV pilus minor pilin ComGD [Enterococcus dispar]
MKNIIKPHLSSTTNPAFTIAESLVTLVVITIFLLIPTLTLQPFIAQMKVELFLAQFEQNFLLLQQTAITQQTTTTLKLNRPEHVLQFEISEQKNYPDLPIPIAVSCTMPQTIVINKSSGNYSGMESVTFKWEKKKITYQFQLGSGRFVKTIT